MAEADLKKAATGGGIGGIVDVSDRCSRLLGQLCFAGSAIDPRAIRALAFLTDSVDVSGSVVSLAGGAVDVSDRCARLLGQLCFGGIPIDPRQIRNLTFIADKVDVSGSSVTTIPGSVATMDDAFMELRLMADALKDIPLTIDPSTSNVRVITQSGSVITTVATVATVSMVSNVTNLAQIGGVVTSSFIFDEMDIVFNTGIRPQIV